MSLTGKTIGELPQLSGITQNTLFAVEYNGTTFSLPYSAMSSTNYTEITYSELVSLYSANTLTPGQFYYISDFQTCYDQPDFDVYGNPITTGNYRTSDIDPIIVLATSNSSLAKEAYQPSYPKDTLKYDITFSTTEVTNSPAKGRITERIDDLNNRTDYDHRTIKFKRYTTYFLNADISGRITGMTNLTVYGSNTFFTSDLTEDSIIFLEYTYPVFYRVVTIISDTEMIVDGIINDNFTDAYGYKIFNTGTRIQEISGGLYYFNDIGNNDIDDGGNDMYDGGNELYTNLSSNIPYTHTQMTSPPYSSGNQVPLSAFAYDGTVQSGDDYFGTGSQYFTNLYPGLFVMVAKDVTITDFEIDGNLGSDGNGQADLFDYTFSLSGNDFSVYCKRVWDAGDPSVNHIMIVNTIDENITHDADLTTEDDRDTISNLTGVTQVHYLLFGLSSGVKPTNTQIQNVVSDYLSVIDLSDINNTLTNLNLNFSAVTSSLPPNGNKNVSLEWKQPNFTGDTSYYEQYTFSNVNSTGNNYIGDYSIYNNTFLLSNNVFTNSDDNTVDILSNKFGDNFYNNSFGDDVIGNLFIGKDFYNNIFYDRVRYNVVNRNFYNNLWLRNELNSNIIGDDCSNNYNTGGSVSNNEIGNDFNNNQINGDFYQNRIGNLFINNKVRGDFYNNNILNTVESNSFYGSFYYNKLSQNFQNNNVWSQTYNNEFGDFINNNNFGVFTNLNTYSIYFNKFGNNINNNTFSGTTSYNEVLNYFETNTIGDYFSYNQIGNYFTNNVILEGFGFGGSQSQKNIISDNFQNNTIGEYFYNNTVTNYFQNNTIGNYFQKNNVETQISFVDFTQFYGNLVTINYNAPGSTATDGSYTGVSGTGGDGINATFDIVVSSNVVTSLIINQSGKLYTIGSTILILGSQIGGTDSVDDITINIVDVSRPSVYESYNCNIFQREGGVNRLSYFDSSDVLTVKNIDA